MISITNVHTHLANFEPKIWQPPQKDASLRDIYFLSTNDLGDSSLLYMGTVSAVLPIIDMVHHNNLLLIEDVPITVSIRTKLLQQGCTLIVLPEGTDLFRTFNFVKKVFSEQHLFYQESYHLFNELITSKDLVHVIALAEKELNNPVILIDESFKVLQYSKRIVVTDEIWAKNIKNGYCSYEFVSEVNKLNSVRQSPSTMEPFSVICHANKITKWVSKLYLDNKMIGYLVIPECHSQLEKEQVKLLSMFCKIMVHHVSRTTHQYSSKLISQEKLFVDLIENQIHSESELTARLKLSGLSLLKPYQLVMIKGDSFEKARKKTETLHTHLSRLYPDGHQFIYKDSLVLLLSQKEWNHNYEAKKQSLSEILEQKNLRAIYSDSIVNLLDLSTHYHSLVQGFELATILVRQKVLLPYNDLKFYQLLHDMAEKDKLLT
ncbi:hypothetical protein [Bacillus sp. JJ1764]|uniref:hypothetical protein n=1 Tax=Bacillus sp. JJ1764 TaxID=3122964 RepID=UPI002FFEBE3D